MFKASKRIMVKGSAKRNHRVVSSFSLNPFGGGHNVAGGQTVSIMGASSRQNQLDKMLTGIISEDDTTLMQMYIDIYNYDVIAGATVDLTSTLPFSDFTLIGISKEEEAVYASNLERLNIKTLLPQISVDFLVMGKFTGTLVYNKEAKLFTDIIPHDALYTEVVGVPLYGRDPLIKVKPSPEMRKFLSSSDQYFVQLRERLSSEMLKALGSANIALDPLTTVYVPRRTFSTSTGTSILRRIIPIYLLEKVLYRGTLTEANRRQRSTLHVTAGDETWEPTEGEYSDLVNLFQQSELDPLGAIVATRSSVQTQDIRCLAGATKLITPTGEVSIDRICSNTNLAEGTEIVLKNFFVKGYDGEFHKVHSWHYQGKKKLVVMKLNNGKAIEGTEEHKVLTVSKDLSTELVKIGDLTYYHNVMTMPKEGKLGIPSPILYHAIESKELGPATIGGKKGIMFEDNIFIPGNWRDTVPDTYLMYDDADRLYKDLYNVLRTLGMYDNIKELLRLRYDFGHMLYRTPLIGDRDCYDITMDKSGPPLFLANGIVTKNSAGDFWRWDQLAAEVAGMKFRAMGVSENFLSGDQSYNTVEATLSVFIDQMRTYRDFVTHNLLTNKLFPLIASVNGFVKKETAAHNGNMNTLYEINDVSRLNIPTVQWHKSLKPIADIEYMEMLTTLEEKNVPVGLRAWAAAGGLSIDTLVDDLEEDIELRKNINDMKEKGGAHDDIDLAKVLSNKKKVPLLARDFGEGVEITTVSKTGKKKVVHNQKAANEKANMNISKALINMSDENVIQDRLKTAGIRPSPYGSGSK